MEIRQKSHLPAPCHNYVYDKRSHQIISRWTNAFCSIPYDKLYKRDIYIYRLEKPINHSTQIPGKEQTTICFNLLWVKLHIWKLIGFDNAV